MATEENLMILKMLQDGVLSPEQAAELIKAVDAPAPPPAPPTPPVPPTPPTAPTPPVGRAIEFDDDDGDTLTRARAKLAAAREKVAGVQEKLAAAEEKLVEAEKEPNALEKLEEALRDIPGRRSLSEALRGIDPGRLASSARRQAKRLGKQVKHSFDGIQMGVLAEIAQGEPTLIEPREATCSLPHGSILRVKNPLGDIEAVGADVTEAKAAGTLKVWASDRAAAEALAAQIEVVVEEGADGPTITVLAPPKVRRVSLDLKVFVPQTTGKVSLLSPSGDVSARNLRGGSVVLATGSGDARASEIAGDVIAETGSGEIALEGVLGSVVAKTGSGDIQAIRLSGQAFKAETQSGDATLKESTIPAVQLKTVSGDATVEGVSGRTLLLSTVSGDAGATNVSFDDSATLESTSGSVSCRPRGPLALGSLTLSGVSGDIYLVLPARTHASLDARTQSGDLSGKLGDVTLSGASMAQQTLGSGPGATISAHTVSGDIAISQE